jgi:hypothetical protein
VDKKANDTFAFDLENRLDDFFSDALPPQDEPPTDGPPPAKTDLPLKELKSTILAIDWEITDDVLETFIDQLDGLLEQFEDDKVIHTLLKLLKSLGKYVHGHKSKAHPDTIKRIMAVYSALEESVNNDGMSRSEKEKMLLEEVRQFQRLKASIVASKTPHAASGQPKPRMPEEMPGIEAVIQAIDELKSMMAKELGAIRQELGQLRKK